MLYICFIDYNLIMVGTSLRSALAQYKKYDHLTEISIRYTLEGDHRDVDTL